MIRNEANCAYTPLTHPSALASPMPIVPTSIRTHTLLNSGLVVFTPSMAVLASMLQFLDTSPLISTFSFPDQDFLAHFFAGRWKPLGWQYNAIKTARYWHPNMWSDDAVRNLHYIVDKPWNAGRKRGEDDEITHGWWWDEFKVWEQGMKSEGKKETVASVRRHMGEEG
jgi:inositol 3-alpha-galactosyltransferase